MDRVAGDERCTWVGRSLTCSSQYMSWQPHIRMRHHCGPHDQAACLGTICVNRAGLASRLLLVELYKNLYSSNQNSISIEALEFQASCWLICVACNECERVVEFGGLNFARIGVKVMNPFRSEAIPNLKNVVASCTVITDGDVATW